jgi:hypothetical protein
MYSAGDTLAGGLPHSDIHGSTPARGSPWLFAACHVLHRLLVPRHPPNALLILDSVDVAPKSRVHHAQKPSSDSVVRVQSSVVSCQKTTATRPSTALRTVLEIFTPHTTGFSRTAPPLIACAVTGSHSTKSFTTPLNPRRRPLGRYPHRQQFPVRQFGRTTHQFSGVSCQGSEPDRPAKPMHQHLLMTRPETHQNLIHISKEQYHPTGQHKRHDHITLGALPRSMIKPISGHSAILISGQLSVLRRTTR